MGYYLRAFICKQADSGLLTNNFDKAVSVDIGQGFSLVPVTEELFDQINDFIDSPSVDRFTYLTENIENKILELIGDKPFSYVEADYFGGIGGQISITWEGNKRKQLLTFGQDRINAVLRYFGVIAARGQDEFLTMGFGLRRHTKEWFE